jgi:hypothetical protein
LRESIFGRFDYFEPFHLESIVVEVSRVLRAWRRCSLQIDRDLAVWQSTRHRTVDIKLCVGKGSHTTFSRNPTSA